MKKSLYPAVAAAIVIGLVIGVTSWWLGQRLMAYKPFEDRSLKKQDPVVAAFQGSGANFKELNFIGWAQINKKYLSEEKLLTLANELSANFGLENEFVLEVVNDNDSRQIKLDNYNTHILVQSKAGSDSTKASTYCSIMISANSLKNYRLLMNQLESSLINVDESDKGISSVITGWYPAVLTAKGMKNIANKTLALSGAKIVEGIGEKNFLSISAYTPQIKSKIRINDHEINFNVALRANAVERKTNIYLGSPLIAKEY